MRIIKDGDYRIELYDRDFAFVAFLEREATGLRWAYSRIGGCADFSFSLPRTFEDPGNISGDFHVKIYIRDGAGTYDLWYSGFIEDRTPNFREPETLSIKGFGYSAQLERIIINKTYTSDEISVIVKDIIDNFVDSETDIIYDASLIADTGFTADTLTFNTTAQSAIQTLAEIAGTREWGVGSDRKFFFKARSSTVNFYYYLKDKMLSFQNIDSYRGIINRIKLEGGEVTGNKFTRTINNTSSQVKFKLREKHVTNSAITSNDVADQFGASLLADVGDVIRKAKLSIVGEVTLMETTVPLGLVVVQSDGVRYNEDYYLNFLYSGNISYQVNKISYSMRDNSTLVKSIDLGQQRPNISEEIGKLSFELEQLRAARE